MAKKNVTSCKDCKYYNNGEGHFICDYCDVIVSDFFEEKEDGKKED